MSFDPKITFDFAQIGGVRLHFARAGEGEKLVILLHGFPESWYSWRHQLSALSDEYTVVAPDLRGYNLSDKPGSVHDYTTDKLVDDVIGLIGHFGRQRASVIGHDWGAIIAWELAEKHPEYLEKVGALQVPPSGVWKKNLTFRQIMSSWYILLFQLPVIPELLLSAGGHALLKRSLKTSTYEEGVFTDEDLEVYERGWQEPGSLTSMLNYYRANMPSRFLSASEESAKIKVPALFVFGQKDHAIIPDSVKDVRSAVESEYEEFFFPLAGHWVQQEAAEAVNQILKEFLAA